MILLSGKRILIAATILLLGNERICRDDSSSRGTNPIAETILLLGSERICRDDFSSRGTLPVAETLSLG